MERILAFLGLCVCVFGMTTTAQRPKEPIPASEVLGRIRRYVNPDNLPTSGKSAVTVSLALDPLSLREVDLDRDEVELVGYLTSSWTDPSLTWQRLMKGRAAATQAPDAISIPSQYVWTPDITGYNYVTAPEVLSPEIVVWKPNGEVLYVPNVRVRFQCDLAHVETDSGANCTLKVGSWTHDGNKIDLKVRSPGIEISNYKENRGYELLAWHAEKEVKKYACCPEPYPDVKFTFNIRTRRSGGISLFGW